MSAPACPSLEQLRQLLAGACPEDDALTSHLDSCAACRKRLEALAGAAGSWGELPARLATGPTADEPALRAVLADLRAGQSGETSAAPLPTRLGKYRIERLIGQGGMGRVLAAFDPSLRRVVAIKLMGAHLAASGIARSRFEREARAAAAVRNEHVVAIHAVDKHEGVPYLVMEYVEGRSLQERIDADAPLRLREVLRIGTQVARGLAAAHAQGVVHRDVKPANILLENGIEHVKITDFGLAQVNDEVVTTQSGVIAGTPSYMSPEQARGEAVDHRSDLFSLGGVLYAMCAGGPAFRGGHPLSVLKRVCEEEPRSLCQVNPEVPEWMAAIIAKMMAKAPEERFQSATEVAELLGQHLAHLQQPAVAPLPAPVAPVRGGAEAPHESREWSFRRVLGLIGFAVFAVAAFTTIRRHGPEEGWLLALLAGGFGLLAFSGDRRREQPGPAAKKPPPRRPGQAPPYNKLLVGGALALAVLGASALLARPPAPAPAVVILFGAAFVLAVLAWLKAREARPAPAPAARRPRLLIGVGCLVAVGLVALVMVMALVWYRQASVAPAAVRAFAPPGFGALYIQAPDPQMKVVLDGGGVARREFPGGQVVREQLRPGAYTVTAYKDGQVLHSELVRVQERSMATVTIGEWGEVLFLPAGVRAKVDGVAVKTRGALMVRVGRHSWAAFPEGKEANLGEFFLRARERRVIDVTQPPR